jgi:nickel-dependent lactate racemase
MTCFYAHGSPDSALSHETLRQALTATLDQLGPRRKVIALPPDYSRIHGRAGLLTCHAHAYFQTRLADVLPATGTHRPMSASQLARMFPSLPTELIRHHNWRRDSVTIGEVPPDFVRQATGGLYDRAWPVQMNRLVWEGGHDLILSLGQVVPHEVVGMANHNKNLFVGTGGVQGIGESHYLAALCGIERTLGQTDTPLRRILDFAESQFCQHLPLLYVLTVVGQDDQGNRKTRGLFIGDDTECFHHACRLAREVNITRLEKPAHKIVVYLPPDEYQSTWLGNKAIYRTRLAVADQGELIVMAPGVKCFGEDHQIDRLIRRFGYRPASEVRELVERHAELASNLAAAAHLIHGSPAGRFRVTYCPGKLSEREVVGVGFEYATASELGARYPVDHLRPGWNTDAQGEEFYFVDNPASGLWTTRHISFPARDRSGEG